MNKDFQMPQNYWINSGVFYNRFYVFYDDIVYDLTAFIDKHPGGRKAIQNYKHKDLTSFLFTVYPHPPQIIEKLKRYEVGKLAKEGIQDLNRNQNKEMMPAQHKTSLKKSKLLSFEFRANLRQKTNSKIVNFIIGQENAEQLRQQLTNLRRSSKRKNTQVIKHEQNFNDSIEQLQSDVYSLKSISNSESFREINAKFLKDLETEDQII